MKLSPEMKRAILAFWRWSDGPPPTIMEYIRETYVGQTTIRALRKRGLVEFLIANGDGIAREVFSQIQLTPAGQTMFETLRKEKKT